MYVSRVTDQEDTLTSAVSADGDAAARFDLRITVTADAVDKDFIVEGSEANSVADLAHAVASTLGVPELRSIWSERVNGVLEPSAPLHRSSIRWGDRLLLVPPPHEPTRVGGLPLVQVVVTGGPCSGQRWMLGEGDYRIGRAPDAELHLADPSLSREHASVEIRGDTVTITDLGSSNGTAIAGRLLAAGAATRLRDHDELEMGRSLIRIRSLETDAGQSLPQRRGRIELNRPPRVSPTVEPFRLELTAPPSRAHGAGLQWASYIAPLALGGVMFLLLKSPFMLAICALSPAIALTNYLSSRRTGKKAFAHGSAAWRIRLASAEQELEHALVAEATQRRRDSPDAAVLFERVDRLDATVWERRPHDRDFMSLRIGVADLPAHANVTFAQGGADELRSEAEMLLEARRTITSVPLTVDLPHAGVLGLAGMRPVTEGLARWLVLQAAILHSPSDLAIAAAVDDRAADDWEWLKWLPHVGEDRVALQRPLARGRREASELLGDVRDLIAERRAQSQSRDSTRGTFVTLLLVLDEDVDVDRALVSASLADATENGVVAIWLGRERRNLPGQTRSILEAQDERSVAAVTDVDSGVTVADITVDGVDLASAVEVARALAPIQDIGELARAGDIPPRIGLLDLIGLSPVTRSGVERRWKDWSGRLDATIGVGADGPVTVDLRSDGPHALIAGTTGSGKSELLRTFVASAAASVPPDRLEFLLVDYKGGSAFAPCAGLPHVIDVVSDLDEHLAERALVSLEAELKRRERILAENGAKDLLELQRKAPEVAPPLLVIVVDEFAKLRDEVPEFVDGVVDIAQRGRSLGVHMVLAAQTLRNAFTPAIRANTNLRLALRVADDAESEDVIASPLAARIPSGERYRGRAFVRTGHSELREFQTAYVSGRTALPVQRELQLVPFSVDPTARKGAAGDRHFDDDDDNDLTALAAQARDAQQHLGLRPPSPPWLQPLPTVLALDSLPKVSEPGCVAIGLVDLPHLQRQDPLVIDLPNAGNVAVYGGGGTGKTTVLTTTALALARRYSPDELRLYGLDAGSGELSRIDHLPHSGGVVRMDDEELVTRVFRELLRGIDAHPGPGERGGGSARRTVLFLDDVGSFISLHDKPGSGSPAELLQKVMTGGRAAGVHVILTASRRAAISGVISAQIGQRLVLRMPTYDELLTLGLDAKRVRGAKLPPGRGFTHDSLEFQVAIPTSTGHTPEFTVAASAVAHGTHNVTRLSTLPVDVPRGSLTTAKSLEQIPIGIANSDLGTATVDLSDAHFLVVGGYRTGRSTTLSTLALETRDLDSTVRMWLLAPRRSPLRDMAIWERSAATGDACAQVIGDLVEEIASRDGSSPRILVFIDDGGEIADPAVAANLERAVKSGRDSSITFLAAVETGAARGFGVPWIRELRRDGHGFLLAPDLLADGDLLGTRLPRRIAVPMTPGRGFLVSRGTAELVQVAS